MKRVQRTAIARLVISCSMGAFFSTPLRASPLPLSPDEDGVYGRFDGDLNMGLGFGVEQASEATLGRFELAAHYFSVSGLRASLAQALANGELERNLAIVAEVKPLFVARWVNGFETGPGYLDLIIDSLMLGGGVFWQEPTGRSFGERGFQASLGLGLPVFGKAAGLWLERYAAMPRPLELLSFIDQFRTYVVGYTASAQETRLAIDEASNEDSRWPVLEQAILANVPQHD
jgi:hypothetical protein